MKHDYVIRMNERYIIPNLKNACRVLKALSREEKGFSLSELSRNLEIPRTTALRILATLEHEGFVHREDSTFTLGNGLINVGLKALAKINIRTIAVPILHDLANETGETAHLVILSDDRALILEVCDSPHPLRVASRPGTLTLLHCSAAGKLLMAHCIRNRIPEIFKDNKLEKRTAKTITSIAALEREMDKVIAQGYGLDDEEYFEGIRCLAAPIRNNRQEVVAAIGITGTTTRFTPEKIEPFSRIVINAASKVSSQLGS